MAPDLLTQDSPPQSPAPEAGRSVVVLPIEAGLVCLRGLSPRRLRFEVEYGLERGTSANSFLFSAGPAPGGHSIPPVLVHPPGASFAEPFLEQLAALVEAEAALKVVVGHVNPNRVALLRQLAERWPALMLVASNAGARLLEELWSQQRPAAPGAEASAPADLPPLPPIDIVKQEVSRPLAGDHRLTLIPAPTPRWPGALIAFEERTGLLMSGKFFAAHLCSDSFAEANRSSSEEDRRYFYDCLMAPMTRQVESVLNRLDALPIRTIAPGHGPAIAESWRSLLVDYRRWGESQGRAKLSVALLFASAYGNTAAIADAIAQGVARTGVRVESINCEFASPEQLLEAIRGCDAFLVGSPTLGGHAPTPIVAALGTLLAEGDRSKPVGVFGSFGWSGEALDLLESKLRDGGFRFAFEPIKVKFSPDAATLKACEETGTALGRRLQTEQRKAQRRSAAGGLSDSRSNPALQALGRVVGPLSVVTAVKGEGPARLSGAMVASWVSQASFSPPGVTIAVAKDRAIEALLHVGDAFALNVLAEGRESGPMRQFLQPFPPGADRFAGLELEQSPGGQPLLPEALAWLEGRITQRMECGDHWLVLAEVTQGGLLDGEGATAVHQRRSGAMY
ncbi:diflavin flavoprotein [Vulcanococcus limneticus Candia 3F8]|uniref:diflavin flavoprotein n=1 Tax=Vulcanococcus limneticus TaxID=2170428 RepID=UPI000B98C9D1|nr:diflavin flavoprotein [Vulcanococcus limneticus]MCP9793510.1 diflavin flavoprotein [Vulcanococcus limneticus MW73D5]MCP9895496.1 diflavin flavoprotein [Vulcanococcus limneticus Candia 3F8]MCP9898922.1 diflavin flavoprotein [Vulcanococcus limneticus Candia 3B3]